MTEHTSMEMDTDAAMGCTLVKRNFPSPNDDVIVSSTDPYTVERFGKRITESE